MTEEFTKEELRIIETLAYSEAIVQARYFLDLAIKLFEADKLGKELSFNSVLVNKAQKAYEDLMIISAKAGKMSEGDKDDNSQSS